MPQEQLHDKTSSSVGGSQFSLDYWVWVCSLSGFKFKQSFNLYRNYYPALLPQSPLVQTLHPENFWRWWYETFERMDNSMEGQEEEQNNAITLSTIRKTDICGWSSSRYQSIFSRYQSVSGPVPTFVIIPSDPILSFRIAQLLIWFIVFQIW